MKKNLFFGLFATMMLLLTTACQKENDLLGNGEATISFEISTPQMATRAFSDGTTAKVLQYAVYDENGAFIGRLSPNAAEFEPVEITDFNGKRTINIQLAAGKTYYVLFWASAPNSPYSVNYETKVLSVDYTNTVCNSDANDAFYCYKKVIVDAAKSEPVSLTRPFAQLNIGTNDLSVKNEVDVTKTGVKVKGIYNTFNLAENVLGGDINTEYTFALAARPEGETFKVDGYEYLAMAYVLVGNDKNYVTDIKLCYGASAETAKTREFTNIPVRGNYRTNIYGALLTNNIGFDVEIEEDFDGDAVSTEAEKLVVAAQTGGTYTLTEDIILTEALNVTAEFTLNLNSHNIYIDATYDNNNYEASSAIVNGDKGVLTLTGNGEIKAENNYTVRNNGKMVIDGVTIKNGVMNFGDLTIESGSISNDRSGKHAIYGNNAKLTVNGGTFHNENAGNATIFAYAGEVIINDGVFTIADGTATFGWTSCLLDAQGSAKFTINGGKVNGEIRDYNNNTTIYGGTYSVKPNANFIAAGYVAVKNSDNTYSVVKGSVAANAAEFIAAVNNIEDGDVIALSENVNFTADNRTELNGYYEGLYYEGDKSFTIDLGGKSISNTDGAVNDYLMLFKNNGTEANTITIKNGTIDAGTAAYCAICTSSTSAQRVTINLENVNIINNNSGGSTIKVRGGAVLNVKEGTVITGTNSYLGIECIASTANIYDGAEIYMNGTSSYNGCLVGVGGYGTVNVYGGYGKGVSGGLIAMTSGGTINAMGGEWIANTDGTYANDNKSVLVAQSDNNRNSVVNVTGGTYKGGYNCYGNAVGDAQINISGGNFNADPSSYLADGKSATENGGVWTVQ